MNPAEQLKGLKLSGGWDDIDHAKRRPNATGGHFSHGYIVSHPDGRRGFLKALDYTSALSSADPTRTLLALLQAYEFERTLCEKCNHLSRIARAIDRGAVVNPSNPFLRVDYLIFELAERDIRAHLDLQEKLDMVLRITSCCHRPKAVTYREHCTSGFKAFKCAGILARCRFQDLRLGTSLG